MEESTENLDKLYYSIGEVADMLHVNTSLIRFWEKEFGSLIKPRKNRNGKRMFTSSDISNLKQIYYLTKEKGYTLSGARSTLSGKKQVIEKEAYVAETLSKMKSFLIELKAELDK
jgi:DNA-binding transcriptional MerR regulator